MILGKSSIERLKGVHPDLVVVIKKAAQTTNLNFIVTEGLRTVERQKQLVSAGASRTMKSRHLTGHAVDLAVIINGEVRWDWPLYPQLAKIIKQAASDVKIPIEWGGDWKSFRDGPHFQLPFASYPDLSHNEA